MKKILAFTTTLFSFFAFQAAQAEQLCQPESILATAPNSRFELSGSVAKDRQTGLMWKRCLEGTSGANCEEGEPREFSWPKALLHAQETNSQGGYAGHDNWRLPNIKELKSIAELQCVQPSLNLEVFPSVHPRARVWTSSPYRFYEHYAKFVDFSNMTTNHVERFQKFNVFLVRDMVGEL